MPRQPTLLVVDDAPEMALIVSRLGERAGHGVACRGDVPSAWAYLVEAAAAERLPELVLVDINLPGEKGWGLCPRLRAEAAPLAQVQVALFSQQSEDVAAGLEAGADFVVAKDLLARPEAWHRRLGEILALVRGQTSSRPLHCLHTPAPCLTLTEAIQQLQQTLRHPALRALGRPVLHILVRRALLAIGRGATSPRRVLAELSPLAGGSVDPDVIAQSCLAEQMPEFAAALAEQVWRVLGTPEVISEQ